MESMGDDANEMGDDLPAVDLGLGRTGKQVSAGAWHSCALLDDDSVKCWGSGFSISVATGGEIGVSDHLRTPTFGGFLKSFFFSEFYILLPRKLTNIRLKSSGWKTIGYPFESWPLFREKKSLVFGGVECQVQNALGYES